MKKISTLLLFSAFILTLGCKKKNATEANTASDSVTVQEDTTKKVQEEKINELTKKVDDYELSKIEGEVVTPKSVPAKWMIVPGTRVGEIRKNSSLKSLEAAYGKRNIMIEGVETIGRSSDGRLLKGIKTKIFRNTPNEIEIIWSDTASIKNPFVIKISGTEEGDWVTNTNVKIGTPLEYLILLNQKDFYFLGFDDETYDGEYNGLVTWNKGRLPNTFGLQLTPNLMSKTLPVFEGFQTLAKFPTNHPDASSLGLRVGKMSFTFN